VAQAIEVGVVQERNRGAPSFLDTCVVQFLLPDFEVNGRQHAVVRVLALRVVEHLDVVEHVLPCSFAGHVGAAPDAFALEELEEAFGDGPRHGLSDQWRSHGSIVTVPPSAHAGFEIVLTKEHLPLTAGELRSLVGMDHHLGLGLPPPDGRKQSLECQVGRHAGLGGPSDNPPRDGGGSENSPGDCFPDDRRSRPPDTASLRGS
jgi:hypothetical protein